MGLKELSVDCQQDGAYNDAKKNDLGDEDDEIIEVRPRTPPPTGPIIELRSREVIFAILVFFLLAVVVGLIVVLASSKVSEYEKNQMNSNRTARHNPHHRDRCEGAECTIIENIKANMDMSLNACDDFWNYSCGGWLSKNKIPDSMDSYGVDDRAVKKIRDVLDVILNSTIVRKDECSAERKFKTLYKSCMNVAAIDKLGAKPFFNILNRHGGWALMKDWNLGSKSGQWKIRRFLSELHFEYDVSALFSLVVGKDDKDNRDILQFDQGGLGLKDFSDYEDESKPLVIAYKKYMATVAGLLLNESNQYDPEKINEFVNLTFQFEKNLAKIQKSEKSAERKNPETLYNKITVEELQSIGGFMKWEEFLRNISVNVTNSTQVLVTSKDYFKNLCDVYRNTTELVINYYFTWRLMFKFAAPLLSAPYRNAEQEFQRVEKSSVKTTVHRCTYCRRIVGDWFGHAIGSEYIRMKDFDFSSKEKSINDMIENIKFIFKRTLQQNGWMDNSTREAALKKLEKLKFRIGFPEFILNHTLLNSFYEDLIIKDGATFFENILSAHRYTKQQKMKSLEQGIQDEDDWPMDLYDVNAYYSFSENIVGLPAGLMQSPFFDSDAYNYINYGSLGTTIAHEIIHAFDENGALYDHEGNLRNWWTDLSYDKFRQGTDCVRNIYNVLMVDGMLVDGEMTLNENIADIGGVILAYKAYKRWEEKNAAEPNLPGLNLSNDKVFFVTFAQNWCKARRKESVKKFMEQSQHAIEEIRVTATLSQSPQFNSTFNCTKSSRMTPTHTCTIW